MTCTDVWQRTAIDWAHAVACTPFRADDASQILSTTLNWIVRCFGAKLQLHACWRWPPWSHSAGKVATGVAAAMDGCCFSHSNSVFSILSNCALNDTEQRKKIIKFLTMLEFNVQRFQCQEVCGRTN